MTRFHIALGVTDVQRSIEDYSQRFGCRPVAIVPDEYALWRTNSVNFSIRRTSETGGTLRHLGWEDAAASTFTKEMDVNGVIWERFNCDLQVEEIRTAWPSASFRDEGG